MIGQINESLETRNSMWGYFIILVLLALGTEAGKQQQPQEGKTSTEYQEGDNITLIFEGKLDALGCTLQTYQEKYNTTCCYIDPVREKHNHRGKLCGIETQPNRCSKRIKVHEIYDYESDFDKCTMTILDSIVSDGGEYKVVFPFEPESNAVRRIIVVKTGLYILDYIIIFSVVIFIIVCFCFCFCFGKKHLKRKERERERRREGERRRERERGEKGFISRAFAIAISDKGRTSVSNILF